MKTVRKNFYFYLTFSYKSQLFLCVEKQKKLEAVRRFRALLFKTESEKYSMNIPGELDRSRKSHAIF